MDTSSPPSKAKQPTLRSGLLLSKGEIMKTKRIPTVVETIIDEEMVRVICLIKSLKKFLSGELASNFGWTAAEKFIQAPLRISKINDDRFIIRPAGWNGKSQIDIQFGWNNNGYWIREYVISIRAYHIRFPDKSCLIADFTIQMDSQDSTQSLNAVFIDPKKTNAESNKMIMSSFTHYRAGGMGIWSF